MVPILKKTKMTRQNRRTNLNRIWCVALSSSPVSTDPSIKVNLDDGCRLAETEASKRKNLNVAGRHLPSILQRRMKNSSPFFMPKLWRSKSCRCRCCCCFGPKGLFWIQKLWRTKNIKMLPKRRRRTANEVYSNKEKEVSTPIFCQYMCTVFLQVIIPYGGKWLQDFCYCFITE